MGGTERDPARRPYADDREWLTAAEFAALGANARHAVWDAHRGGLVEGMPATPGTPMLRYRRDQVRAVLRGLETEGAGRGDLHRR